MNKDQVLGLIRHVLTFFGGIVVARGLVDESTLQEILGGLISVIGGVWSIVAKKTPAVVEKVEG